VPEKPTDTKINAFSESYNNIATRASLRDIKLVSTKFDVLPSFFTENESVKLHLDNSVEDLQFSRESSIVLGAFVYQVRATLGRKRVLHCKGHFLVVYDIPEGGDEEAAKAFCGRVGFFAAYPYFRALFATLTRFGGAELPILPVLSSSPQKPTEAVANKRTKLATSPQ
jgi:hypothetical protein